MKGIFVIICVLLVFLCVNSLSSVVRQKILVREVIAVNEKPYEQRNDPTYRKNRQPLNSDPTSIENANDLISKGKFARMIGSASITLLYAVMIWRSVTLHEIIKELPNIAFKRIFLSFAYLVAVINCFGLSLNFIRPMQFKNLLKVGVWINVALESIDALSNLFMIGYNSARPFPKEFYVGRIFGNIWFLMFAIANAKSRWVFQVARNIEPQPLNPRQYQKY